MKNQLNKNTEHELEELSQDNTLYVDDLYHKEKTPSFSFDSVKNIINQFSYYFSDERVQRNQMQKEVSDYFDNCLTHSNPLLGLELITKGYKPTYFQNTKFKKQISEHNQKDPDFLINYSSKISHVPDELFVQWIEAHYHKYYYTSKKIPKDIESLWIKQNLMNNIVLSVENKLGSVLSKMLKSLKVGRKTLGIISSNGTESHNDFVIKKFYNIISFYDNYLHNSPENVSKEKLINYHQFLTKSLKKMNKYLKSIGSYSAQYNEQNVRTLEIYRMEQLIEKTNSLISSYLTKSHEDMVKKVNHINPMGELQNKLNDNIRTIDIDKDLPKEAKILIEQINTKYKKIKNDPDNVIDLAMIEIDTLYEKNTLKIVQKYLSIDDDFKTKLKDSKGRNSKEIMMDSLEETNAILDNKLLEINQSKMKDLSISNTVLKAKKIGQ